LNAQQFRHVPAKGFLREPAFELTLQPAKESKKKQKPRRKRKSGNNPRTEISGTTTVISIASTRHARHEKETEKREKGGFTRAHWALLAGVVAIVLGGANFAELATKMGVALVLFYVFTGGVFEMRN